jgi:hypothetical protein
LPVRDLRREPSGSGRIVGVVLNDGESQRPIRRASVELRSDVLMTNRRFFTRDDGSFAFDGLPAGEYSLSASQAGFVTEQYGAWRQGGTGSSIALADKQLVTGIVFRLSRYASISGVVYDQNGEPAPDISVEALRYTARTGRPTLSSVFGRAPRTDDRGVYRIAGLVPGDYYVVAGPNPDRGPTDAQFLTTADVERAMQLLSAPGPVSTIAFDQPVQAFAPVYFPGSTEFSQAQAVHLSQSEQRSGIDIRLQLVRSSRIEGTLSTADGRPIAGQQVAAVAVTGIVSLELFSATAIVPVSTDASGRFVFPAMTPGHYVLRARVAGGWAVSEVEVNGVDQTVRLVVQPGATVSGKAVFSGTIAAPEATAVSVGMANLDRVFNPFFGDPLGGVAAVNLNPDGTFVLSGVPPGRYRLQASLPSSVPNWALRSAFVNGVDSLDTPFVVAPGQSIETVTIVYTDRPTTIAGTLLTPAGVPTADYFIIAFSSDRALWATSMRRSAMARPSSTGRYELKNLPPGEYLVVAVTDVEQGDWWNPAFLERLVPAAAKITLSEGETKALDLKIGGAPSARQIARRAGPCPCPAPLRTSAGTGPASGWPPGR